MSNLHTINGQPVGGTAAEKEAADLKAMDIDATVTGKSIEVTIGGKHKAECGIVGDVGEVGNLGSNAAE